MSNLHPYIRLGTHYSALVAKVAKSSREFHPGERVELEITGIAHGGETVARSDGWVFFVRYAIPGERVIAEITQTGKSFHRADAVEIITASVDRVTPECRYFHPGGCGGCDFHHISARRQRELKSQVITEQFARVAKMDITIPVAEVPLADRDTTGYRTRMTLSIDSQARAGFYKVRSHEIQPIEECIVAADHLEIAQVLAKRYPDQSTIQIPSESRVEQITVRGKRYTFRVSSESFWQGHLRAAEVLGERALAALAPEPGERALDLYGGVGLFGKLLADSGCEVEIIESSASASDDCRFNLQEFSSARVHEGAVERKIREIQSAHLVLLDPPRSGAEHEVLRAIVALAPRRICYISCDPASLARDSARLAELGYRIAEASAYDLFPQTAHIECVFTFEPVIS